MDINTNVSQQSTASLAALKAANSRTSVDKSNQSEVDAVSKVDIKLPGAAGTVDAQDKDANNDVNLKKAVDDLNGFIQNTHRDLQFSIDEDSGTMVVRVIDSKSEKVIRQIPNEETLRLARSLAEDKQDVSFNIFSSRA